MKNRIVFSLLLAIAVALPLSAQMHRRAVAPPPASDVLGIGPMGGSVVGGTVASVAGNLITLQSGGAAAIRIDATSAKIVADRDAARTLADVVPGVRITAFINDLNAIPAGAALPAQVIIIDRQPDVSVSGAIQSIDLTASTFTVLGIPFVTNASTVFSTAFPTFAPITGVSGLATGQRVDVEAAFAGPMLLAKRVFVMMPGAGQAQTALRGKVKTIGETAWVITDRSGSDITVQVNEHTKIVGDPKAGDEVQVMATKDSAQNYVAVLIMKLGAPEPGPAQMHGWVKSIASDQWSIGGPPGSMAPEFLVKITPSTVIYPNPKVGDIVEVTGSRDSSGIFVATKIELARQP